MVSVGSDRNRVASSAARLPKQPGPGGRRRGDGGHQVDGSRDRQVSLSGRLFQRDVGRCDTSAGGNSWGITAGAVVGAAADAPSTARAERRRRNRPARGPIDREGSGHRIETTHPCASPCMGVNGRGRQLLPALMEFPEVEIAHICDPDERDSRRGQVRRSKGKPPWAERIFARRSTTPSSTSLSARPRPLACPGHDSRLPGGKGRLRRKAVWHNLLEGQRMVEAARRYHRVVQAGTQRRSGPRLAEAVERVRERAFGKGAFGPRVDHERSAQHRARADHLAAPDARLRFMGGAGRRPALQEESRPLSLALAVALRHGRVRKQRHPFPRCCPLGTGCRRPAFITCGGSKYHFDDDQETPDTQLATFDFAHAAIEWEHRTWSKRGEEGSPFGVVFYGTEGTLVALDYGWKIYHDRKVVEEHAGTGHAEWVDRHFRNFLDCRLTRKQPAADIEIGHRSTVSVTWQTSPGGRGPPCGSTALRKRSPIIRRPPRLLNREYRKGYRLPAIT